MKRLATKYEKILSVTKTSCRVLKKNNQRIRCTLLLCALYITVLKKELEIINIQGLTILQDETVLLKSELRRPAVGATP